MLLDSVGRLCVLFISGLMMELMLFGMDGLMLVWLMVLWLLICD